jgi:ParB-like chromosome segregation protein Spo0J
MSADLQFHPLADIFPLMEGEEFEDLVADIKANGQHARIVLKDGMILDGRNRYRACLKLGIEPSFACEAYSDQIIDPAAYVISANIHRRHLNAAQKRDLIAKLLKANPTKSDRQIAKTVKASPTYVGKVRAEKEATGDVSTVDTRTDTKGRKQPAKKKRRRQRVTETDEQRDKRRLEFEAMMAEEAKLRETVWREIECFTDALIATDANLAQRLFVILRDNVDFEGREARDILTEALEGGLKPGTLTEPDDSPEGGIDVSAEGIKRNLDALGIAADGLDIPESLRRSA